MNRLSLLHAPLALYHFDRSLEDLSGNGFHLTGTAVYSEMEPQVFGLAPGSDVRRPSYDAALALDGDMTIEVDGYFYGTPSAAIFASFTNSGETLATNTFWQLSAHTSSQLRWIHEHGSSGTDAAYLSTGAIEALPRPHTRFTAAAVRKNGVVSLYLNGRLHGQRSAILTAPNGGTTAFLRVMFGSTAFGLLGLKIMDSALTDAEIAEESENILGVPPNVYGTLWVGAVTDTSAAVVARMSSPVEDLSLILSDGEDAWESDAFDTDPNGVVRFDLEDLEPDTEYTYSLPSGSYGRFRTLPAASGSPASFTVALGGDAVTGSGHPVFHKILEMSPHMFIHMGDLHYNNHSTNNQSLFHGAFDSVLASTAQHKLYRSIPTAYVWDDHDYGGNNSDGNSASKPAAAAVYRSRVPHYPLAHSTAIYQYWDIGRVRFIMTDQRSEASSNSATDNSSKTMLGATQKAWFKNLIANSPGMMIVWICPRWFAHANHADSWNNFSTERTELCDWIKTHAHGRVVVFEADQHTLAIDDGSNIDYATGGGEPLRCFRAAPLDKTPSAKANTYSHGEFNDNGQFGVMEVEDSGGSSIDVTWIGYDSTGSVLTTYSFSVAV